MKRCGLDKYYFGTKSIFTFANIFSHRSQTIKLHTLNNYRNSAQFIWRCLWPSVRVYVLHTGRTKAASSKHIITCSSFTRAFLTRNPQHHITCILLVASSPKSLEHTHTHSTDQYRSTIKWVVWRYECDFYFINAPHLISSPESNEANRQ